MLRQLTCYSPIGLLLLKGLIILEKHESFRESNRCNAVVRGVVVDGRSGSPRLVVCASDYTVARVLMVAGLVWAGQYLWRQKTTKTLLIFVSVIAAILLGMSFYYLRAEHVIFSTLRDDLVFRAYCKGRPPLVFATYVEISSPDGTPISLYEIPPSSDDLADCKARFPIVDMRPDPTYSCLRISFENNTRSPLLMPLPLVDGLASSTVYP